MWLKVCCAFVLYSLAGCAGVPLQAPLHDGSYPLQPGQSVDIGGGATVRYDEFVDSRCPQGAACIWAGKVSYAFSLSGASGSEQFALDYSGQTVDAKTVPGVRFGISFAQVSSVPVAQHAVVLEVAQHAR